MNTLVYGHNSLGKTERIMVNEINKKIENNESFLFLDTKEEYYKHYQEQLESNGYKINVLNLRSVLKSNCWNPLSLPFNLYNKDRDKAVELIKDMGNVIFDDPTVKDKFWVNMSSDLFVGLCLILFEYAREDAINLFSVNKMIEHDDQFDYILKTYDATRPIHMALAEVAKAPKETKESVYTVFRQKLNTYLLYENLSTLLSYTDYDMMNIVNDKVALFVINKDENKNINSLAHIYINQVFQVIVNEELPYKFNFILDNLESLELFNHLNDFLEVSNSRSYDVMLAVRDLDWYKKHYRMSDIDIIYNMNIENAVIKVEKEQKRRYPLNDYPKIRLNKTGQYPELQTHPKFLFNLTKFIDSL